MNYEKLIESYVNEKKTIEHNEIDVILNELNDNYGYIQILNINDNILLDNEFEIDNINIINDYIKNIQFYFKYNIQNHVKFQKKDYYIYNTIKTLDLKYILSYNKISNINIIKLGKIYKIKENNVFDDVIHIFKLNQQIVQNEILNIFYKYYLNNVTYNIIGIFDNNKDCYMYKENNIINIIKKHKIIEIIN